MLLRIFVVLKYVLMRFPQIYELFPHLVTHHQLILAYESTLKHQLIVIDQRIETAIVDQFLELSLLFFRQLVVLVEFVLLLEQWG